jgi:hypothetical protein
MRRSIATEAARPPGRAFAAVAAVLLFALLAIAGAVRGANGAGGGATPKKHRGPRPSPTPMALPPELKATVPVYRAGALPFRGRSELEFAVSWVGIPAANVKMSIHPMLKDSSRLIGECWIETTPFADLFYRMRDYLREDMSISTFEPSEMHIVQHENSRLNYYDVTFDRSANLVSTVKRNHKGSENTQFAGGINGWGPISAALMALTQTAEPHRKYEFDVFMGTDRYVVSFDLQDREHVHVALGDFDAWRIVPDILYMSNQKLRGEGSNTVLWISADQRHLPLRIQSAVYVGYMTADLVRAADAGGAIAH